MTELTIDPKATALVVIDLQKGVQSNPQAHPHSAQEVISNAAKLVEAFRAKRLPVFLVRVVPTPEIALRPVADEVMSRPAGAMPADWSDFVPELTPQPTDVVITKRQWGAFYGTDLELQLRRRKIDTIVLCGIATDYGVESTARFAYEYGYQQVFAEDAMTSRSEEQHNAAVKFVFRRMGRVRTTGEIIGALG